MAAVCCTIALPACREESPRGIPEWSRGPFFPGGTVQANLMEVAMAGRLETWAAMGRPCATDSQVEPFLAKGPKYAWMRGQPRDMKTGPWALFGAGMKEQER